MMVHGSESAYRGHGCRCTVCRGWKAAESAKYRAGRKARNQGSTNPGQGTVATSITLGEYNQRMVGRTRPLTDDPMGRHSHGTTHNLAGEFA